MRGASGQQAEFALYLQPAEAGWAPERPRDAGAGVVPSGGASSVE
jgi:hypothetical protein